MTLKYLICLSSCFLTVSVNAENTTRSSQADNIEIIEVNAQKRPQDIRDDALYVDLVDGQINIATFANDQAVLTTPGRDVSGKINDSNLSGKFALLHNFNRQHSGFVSFSRGSKSGGYNGALVSSAAEVQNNDYGSEKSNAYEIGLHNQLSRSARLYSSAFYYDYQDQQVFINQSVITLGTPPLQLLSNMGESTIYAAKINLNAKLTPALSTKLSIGYLPEANLASFIDAAGVEIIDHRLPFTSIWNIAAQADYVVELSSGQLSFYVDADYQSGFCFDQKQSPFAI
jgi:iron complex outermembrane receptor protein